MRALGRALQLLHAGPSDVVDPAVGTVAGPLPVPVDQALLLQPPQGAVEASRIGSGERPAERAESLEQVVTVGRLFAKEEQETRPKEAARGQRRGLGGERLQVHREPAQQSSPPKKNQGSLKKTANA